MTNLSGAQNFISLDSIQIATPCHQEWSKMGGNEKVRCCDSCHKNVYNVASMTREQAESLILRHEKGACVRLHRRVDGTLLTSDCPVGISQLRRSNNALGNFLLTTLAAILGVVGVRIFQSTEIKNTFNVVSMGLSQPKCSRPIFL